MDHGKEAVVEYIAAVRAGTMGEQWIAPTWRDEYVRGEVGSGLRETVCLASKITVLWQTDPPGGLNPEIVQDVLVRIDGGIWSIRVTRESAAYQPDAGAPFRIVATSLRKLSLSALAAI